MLHGFIPLPDYGLIAASGPDARSFLHGQLTNDIENLREDRAQLAGYCSANGRLLALFTSFIADNGDVLLECDTSLLPQTLKRLQMFVLRAQCKLRNADTEYRIIGLSSDYASKLGFTQQGIGSVQRHEGKLLIRLHDAGDTPRHLLVVPLAQYDEVLEQLGALPDLTALTREQWDALQVQSAVPRITAPVVEQFVPQMVNLEALGGVNFKKGCYPGQEVVARSQYRGTLKRRMFPVSAVDAQTRMSAAQELFIASDPAQPAGMIVFSAGNTALAELKLSAAEALNACNDSLHLQSADGALLMMSKLPYTLPTEV